MAHSLSAKKRIRQTAKRRARNRDRKRLVRLELKKFEVVVKGGDKTAVATELKSAQHILDRVSAKGSMHPNTLARRKSKLARRLNAVGAVAK